MLTINRILLATNLLETGALVPVTLQLAQAVGADVHVVHARGKHSRACSAEHVASWFREQVDDWALYPGVTLTYHVVSSAKEAEAIATYAEAHAIDLLAVAAPRVERAEPGVSTAHQLIQRTLLPVLVCPATAAAGRLESIMAPVDFSKPARHACLHAHALAECLGARLDVIHAMRGLAQPEATAPAASALRASVASFCSDALGTEAVVHVAVRSGDPVACILAAASERDTGLIVLQTHGLAGLSRAAIGHVAKRVLHSAPCAVLVLRTYGHALFKAPSHEAFAETAG